MSPDPLTGAVTLSQAETVTLLKGIVATCNSGYVLFDLDSTLLDNRPRNAVIMREFAAMRDQPALAAAQAAHFPNWSARHSMGLLGLTDDVIDELITPYMTFWEERFFTSHYCQYDVEIPGAAEFVNTIKAAGGIVRYLTGRNESMRKGTDACLRTLGFPVPGRADVSLQMKPAMGDSDDAFKQDALQRLSETASIIAGFDNEPTHINFYRKIFPDALSVHLNTDHSMRKVRLLDGVVSIREFC